MKKIIATALSLIVGVFGYTIADRELSARVDDLEASVSSMQEEMSSLHETSSAIGGSAGSSTGYREGYNYGYLKIKLPDLDNKGAYIFGSGNSNIVNVQKGQRVVLDGSEASLLVYIKNNTTGCLILALNIDGVSDTHTYCTCILTEKDGEIHLDDITYFDLSELPPETTTTTRQIYDITTK